LEYFREMIKLLSLLLLLPLTASAQWQIGQRSFTAPSAGGTPSVVQSQSTGATGSQATLLLSSPVTAGNVLVATIFGGGPTSTFSFIDTFGNTATMLASSGLATDGDGIGIVCAPITTGGTDTLTFIVDGSFAGVWAVVYEVNNATCTQDVTAVHSNTLSATSCSSGPMTTSTANDFLVGVCGLDGTNTATITAGSGWSGGLNAALSGPTRPIVMSEYRIGTSAGSFTATSGTFTSEEQATLLVALKP
jgi:hypothetical protein